MVLYLFAILIVIWFSLQVKAIYKLFAETAGLNVSEEFSIIWFCIQFPH